MKPMLRLAVLVAAIGWIVAGCETARPAGGAPNGVRLIPAARVNALVQGMSPAQVLDLLGPPRTQRPYPAGGPGAETWGYRVSSTEVVEMIAVATHEVPAFDPLTGQQTSRQEPIFQNQHIVTYQTLELLFLDGLLTQRTAGREVERWFD